MMSLNIFRMTNLLVFVTSALFVVFPAHATGKCEAGSVTVRTDGPANYMPFSEHAETLSISIEGTGQAACRMSLQLSSGTDGVLTDGGDSLKVEIRTRQGRRLEAGRENTVDVILLPAKANGVSADLIGVIEPRQPVPAGLYEGAFELAVAGDSGSEQRIPFSLAASVVSQADIRLAGTRGGSHRQGVNFGTLEQGEEETALVSVRSNGAYAIELESQNDWHLKKDGADTQNAMIAYDTWFNGFAMPRQSVVRVPEQFQPTGRSDKLSRIRFRIGTIEGKAAGDYHDQVRLTVILLE
jgi:hypothetical protein